MVILTLIITVGEAGTMPTATARRPALVARTASAQHWEGNTVVRVSLHAMSVFRVVLLLLSQILQEMVARPAQIHLRNSQP